MKKLFYLSCCVLAAFLCLTGCAGQKPAITDSSELAGSWYGCGSALGKDSAYRAGNLCLSIDDKGALILSDLEQSADLFHGTISIDSDSQISITEDAAFDNRLPKGWEDFSGHGNFSYQAPDTGHLLLTYGDISYYFIKEGADDRTDISLSPLLDIAETDIWYTSPEESASDSIYELALYDNYAELSSLRADDGGQGTFLMNLLYCDNEGEEFSFYTYRNEDTELPEIFDSLPEGVSRINLRLSSSNESLAMEYDGQSLSFYNNVIYGLNTSSTAYFLNDTCFYWRFDKADHFCHFATDDGTGALCLFISDGKPDDTDANIICMEVTIDEKDSSILFAFDRQRSRLIAAKDSALFRYFKALEEEHGNPLRITYKLKDSKLTLKARKYFGKNYTFDLEDYSS